MRLWSIEGEHLRPLGKQTLDREIRLQSWLERDIGMLDPGLLVIGREVPTLGGARIDILAINAEGALSIIELKRDRTPRDIVAQVLDYASWADRLDTPAVHAIAQTYWAARSSSFAQEFERRFDGPPPEPLNTTHNMVIVASALDPASQRIVEYLSQRHGVGINTEFFTVFGDDDRQFLSASWLMDQDEVVERTERRVRAPWNGDWYVNAGTGEHRSWEDMRKFGFVAAGGGRKYSAPLDRLTIGDRIFVYQKGAGYVGSGVVTTTAARASQVKIAETELLKLPLENPNLGHHRDDAEQAEYVVCVEWDKALSVSDAKTFPGIFANQNVVCKLRDARTLAFLTDVFGSATT